MEPRNPTSAVFFFQNQMQFFFFQNQIYVSRAYIWVVGAKHTQTDMQDRFSKSLYLLRL